MEHLQDLNDPNETQSESFSRQETKKKMNENLYLRNYTKVIRTKNFNLIYNINMVN